MSQNPQILDDPNGDPSEIRPISESEFRYFQALVERESGIYLSPSKKSLLVSRLTDRLQELGLRTFTAYRRFLLEDGGSERVHLIERICTHETAFFREPQQFELLEQQILPGWQLEADAGIRQRRIRAWSAGCSTGEEPYSLAMVLLQRFPPMSGWEIEILATDLSTSAIARSRAGIWRIESAGEIPPRYLKQFMLKGAGGQSARMAAGREIRSPIRFQQLNLNEETYPVEGRFDLILCRNVLIYFEQASRLRAIDRLLNYLEPWGLLLLGHAESLWGRTERVRGVIPSVYSFRSGSRAPLAPASPASRSTTQRGRGGS